MSQDLLDTFLSAASDLCESSNPEKRLKDVDIFSAASSNAKKLSLSTKKPPKSSTVVHSGDTDSSDDEDNKYFEERKYNASGIDIKHLLQTSPPSSATVSKQFTSSWKSTSKLTSTSSTPKLSVLPKQDTYVDPVFGLRIVNPLVSFTTLQDRMVGRQNVTFASIKTFVMGTISDKNWVIAGVIVGKSPVKTSSKGSQFLIWTLSDLKNDIKTVAVFLFSDAYKQLWKTTTGTVVGILNPQLLEKQNGSKDEAVLSVTKASTVMILGQSKDLGTCKSAKKNGDRCTAIVNINRCEYCLYHVKQEYQKCSKRSELQSNFSGNGLTALRNKVLGKNEVFYAGKSYMAIPAKRNKKMEQKDRGRLEALAGLSPVVRKKTAAKKNVSKVATNVEISVRQRLKDLALLEKLGGSAEIKTFSATHSAEVTLETSKQVAVEVLAKLKSSPAITAVDSNSKEELAIAGTNDSKNQKKSQVIDFPMLTSNRKGIVDLGKQITTPKQINRAKLNALKYIQQNGPLKKPDPNSVKKTDKKRIIEIDPDSEIDPKRQKLAENGFLSDRFKKIMSAASKHLDLLDQRDDEEQEKYFHKLETKEKMEEKMMNTFKVACKAVKCLQCKYTSFSASDMCKENKHPLKVFDGVKRFFKCGNCGNRTVTLQIVPTGSCKNCGLDKWERAAMMKEKTVGLSHTLSIRGGEQKFVNSVATDSNLDLLVPDS